MATLRTFSRVFFALTSALYSIEIYAQDDYYWVGNGGDWSDFANHWATTSGGSTMHTEVPGTDDNVFFDGNSFTLSSQTVMLDEDAFCADMDWTGVTNNPTLSGFAFDLDVHGGLTFNSGMERNLGRLSLLGTGTHTLTYGDVGSTNTILTIRGDGSYTLLDDITLSTMAIQNASTTFQDIDVSITSQLTLGGFGVSSGVSTSNWGNSNITVGFRMTFSGNFSTTPVINPGTSTLRLEGEMGGTSFDQNYHDVVISGEGIVIGNNTLENLEIEPGSNVSFEAGTTQTINSTLSVTGTESDPIQLGSTQSGTQATLSVSSGTVNGEHLVLQDMNATGGANFFATESIDNGNNNGWVITGQPPADYFWVGGSGDWSDVGSHWATSSGGSVFHTAEPSLVDNVFFDANSFPSDGMITISSDVPNINCNDFVVSDVTHDITIDGASTDLNIKGSISVPSNFSLDFDQFNFVSVDHETIDFNNGPGDTEAFNFNSSGTWMLQSDLTLSQLNLNAGTFDTSDGVNDYNLSASQWIIIDGTDATQLNINSSDVFAGSLFAQGSNQTLNSETDSELSIRFNLDRLPGGDITLGNVTVVKISTDDLCRIGSDFTINKLKLEPGVTLEINDGDVITFNELEAIGTSTDPIVISSDEPGSTATIEQVSGNVVADFLSLQDITTVDNDNIYLALNSTEGTNVSGWIFEKIPQVITFDELTTRTFGDPSFDLAASGGDSSNPVTFSSSDEDIASIEGSVVTILAAGEVTIFANQAEGDVYAEAVTVDRVLNISKASQSVTLSDIAPKTFGDDSFALIVTGSDTGNTINYTSSDESVATISGGTVSITGAGSTTLTAMQVSSGNYFEATDSKALIVSKAEQEIIFDVVQEVSIGQTISLTATSTSGLPINYIIEGPGNLNGTAIEAISSGIISVTASQDGNSNFNPAESVTRTISVSTITTVTGIDDIFPKLNIYPNPASSFLYVEGVIVEEVQFYHFNGSTAVNSRVESNLVDLRDLKEGAYLLRINNSSNLNRVIIQR